MAFEHQGHPHSRLLSAHKYPVHAKSNFFGRFLTRKEGTAQTADLTRLISNRTSFEVSQIESMILATFLLFLVRLDTQDIRVDIRHWLEVLFQNRCLISQNQVFSWTSSWGSVGPGVRHRRWKCLVFRDEQMVPTAMPTNILLCRFALLRWVLPVPHYSVFSLNREGKMKVPTSVSKQICIYTKSLMICTEDVFFVRCFLAPY